MSKLVLIIECCIFIRNLEILFTAKFGSMTKWRGRGSLKKK